jgi:hypothetical protein
MPSLARSPFLRQIYLESNDLADDQVPAICRFIDTHPYLIRLKLGHNRLSAGAQRAIVAHAQQRNPALFFGSWDLASEFGTPTSTYGATAQGARTADATQCWLVQAEPADAPPFAEAFVLVQATAVGPPGAGAGAGIGGGGGGAAAAAPMTVAATPVDGGGGGGGGKY